MWDSWCRNWHWVKFFFAFLQFPPTNHHSTIAPYWLIIASWVVRQSIGLWVWDFHSDSTFVVYRARKLVFSLLYLFLTNKIRLMRSYCCLCMYICLYIHPQFLKAGNCPVHTTWGWTVQETPHATVRRVVFCAVRVYMHKRHTVLVCFVTILIGCVMSGLCVLCGRVRSLGLAFT
jgi:hypothetical protein